MKKFLIIQTAFLGDVILATPVARTLKLNFPEAEIHFLVKSGNESLLNNLEEINHIWTFNKKGGKLREMRRLIRSFRKENFDAVFNLHRFASSGIIAALSGGNKKYGFRKNPFSFTYSDSFEHEFGEGVHEVDRNLSVLSALNLNQVERKPKLVPSPSDFARITEYQGETYFCFAPASVWFTKQMAEEKWIELLQKHANLGKLYLLGAKDDFQLCQRIIETSGVVAHNLAGQLGLLQSAALMAGASRNYVNDSGPMHLASAMNAPVTAIYCSTIPDFGFGPLSDDSQIKQVAEKLSCRPCGLHGHKACPEGHFKCGRDISFD
jgi:ADP-heptose:LPS heptosyltransferase